MTLLLLFAFLSGVVTIFAPCIWPILPIVLSGSAAGGERRPLGLVAGLSTSFMLATLALAYLIQVIPFDPEILRTLSVVVIAFLGLTLVVPALGARFEGVVSRFASFGGRFTQGTGAGFGGGFVTGFALGLVWSPCAGPILATIAALAATQAVSFQVVIVTFAFVLGVALPLFILALLGQRVLAKTRTFSRYTRAIQGAFGLVMILAALALSTGFDKTLQTRLLDAFPGYERFLNGLEQNPAVKEKLDELKGEQSSESPIDRPTARAEEKSVLKNYGPAPEIVGIEHWLNTETTQSLAELRGKVVLIDFWTYSCVNCIRTLPYVTRWYEQYRDRGFVVIGVHTPEFSYEKKTANVAEAVERYDIRYPVAQDNQYATWQAYSNSYWPAHYLVDAEGNIREYHFGEGNYAETEAAIQTLLEEAEQVASGKDRASSGMW
ncbi:MAG: cytochrome c biogenesis protein DipZ [Candidatus Moraniibacteriota bacterium]